MVVVLVVDIAVLLVGMVVVLAAERAAADVAAHGQMGMSQCCDTDCQICKVS